MSSSNDPQQTLVVPISVSALKLHPDDAPQSRHRFAQTTADFSQMAFGSVSGRATLGEIALQPPIAAGQTLEDGIHIHWAMPDALTHGKLRYQVTGNALNELRLLGVPLQDLLPVIRALASSSSDGELNRIAQSTSHLVEDADWLTLTLRGKLKSDQHDTVESLLTSELAQRHGIEPKHLFPYAQQYASTCAQSSFPAVPNRWIITRFLSSATNGSPAEISKAWLVESDFLTTEKSQCFCPAEPANSDIRPATTVPSPFTSGGAPAPNETQAFYFMGRVIDLDGKTEIPAGKTPTYPSLTALGYGAPEFAAFYPNCRNVFGLHDSLSDVDLGPNDEVSYTVQGWFSDPTDDPAHLDDPATHLASLRWRCPDGNLKHTVFSGLVKNIRYVPAEQNQQKDSFAKTAIAVGATHADALATFLAKGYNHPKLAGSSLGVADVLEALQLGKLEYLTREDGGLSSLEHAVFNSGFKAEPGGTVWMLAETSSEETTGQDAVKNARLDFTGLADTTAQEKFGNDLVHLNHLEAEYQRQLEANKAERWQLFSDWYRYQLWNNSEEGLQQAMVLFSAIEMRQTKIVSDVSALSSFHGKIQKSLSEFRAQLHGTSLELKPVAAPSFYQAGDPVVLISGDAARPSGKHGADGRDQADGLLPCRRLCDALSSGKSRVRAKNHAVRLKLLSNSASSAAIALWDEAMCLIASPSQQTGVRPAEIAIADWPSLTGNLDNPWSPLWLHWDMAFKSFDEERSTEDNIDPRQIEKIAELPPSSSNLTYRCRPQSRPDAPLGSRYQGLALLSSTATSTLAEQVRKIYSGAGETVPSELVPLLRRSDKRSHPILSQALVGFTDALLTCSQSMQFPIHDPVNKRLADMVALWAGSVFSAAPMPNSRFNALRAGAMRLETLQLIDSFGQLIDLRVDQQGVQVSQELQRQPKQAPDDDFQISIPPRLSQPARLDFRLLSSRNGIEELAVSPGASPILGWLLPNHLDRSVDFYGGSGEALGSLRAGSMDAHPLWRPAPGTTTELESLAHSSDYASQILGPLINGMRQLTGTEFAKQILEIDRVMWTIDPKTHRQHSQTAVLLGRPLAIIRAKIGIAFKGGIAASDQSFGAVPAQLPDNIDQLLPRLRDSKGIENVTFPVRLGNLSMEEDGLVGFYLGEQFMPFTAEDQAVPLQLPAGGPAQTVTMLLDPRAKVHATSGILPVKAIDVPATLVEDAMNRLEFSFLVSHRLSTVGENTPDMPTPSALAHEWTFRRQFSSGTWSVAATPHAINDRAQRSSDELVVTEGWLSSKPRLGAKKEEET